MIMDHHAGYVYFQYGIGYMLGMNVYWVGVYAGTFT